MLLGLFTANMSGCKETDSAPHGAQRSPCCCIQSLAPQQPHTVHSAHIAPPVLVNTRDVAST